MVLKGGDHRTSCLLHYMCRYIYIRLPLYFDQSCYFSHFDILIEVLFLAKYAEKACLHQVTHVIHIVTSGLATQHPHLHHLTELASEKKSEHQVQYIPILYSLYPPHLKASPTPGNPRGGLPRPVGSGLIPSKNPLNCLALSLCSSNSLTPLFPLARFLNKSL
jgi:hypothetical protein